MKVLIIEDEAKAGKSLKAMIENNMDTAEVLAIIPSVKSALKWFEENAMPELIFSDIQLSDGLSFEIYRNLEITCPIIFCTAYDEYAIDAFNTNSIDYLLKPIDEEKLTQSINKFSNLKSFFEKEKTKQKEALAKVEEQIVHPAISTILVYFQDKIIPIKVADTLFFYAKGGINKVYTSGGKMYHINHTLDELESKLSPYQFFKASRQFIINRECIHSVHQYFGRRLYIQVKIETPEKILVSKVRAAMFLNWLSS
ncbi:MAG: LytTR family DNA-binding domain-containing protein [Reichenbachiella sp.]|uniref:LytR/AlgR family response regulator transcription factor n=1 Tax=Reichenbachiella sp. TaxID=2184521 RepID=UPI00329707AF